MLKHNLKLFIRNIKKNKSTFLINVIGLGIGIASFLVLALYVYNDFTYNHFHENISNIYRIREGEMTQTKGLLLPKMLEEIPEIENGTRIFDWDGSRLSHGDVAFFETIHYVDSDFFKVFTFPFTEGVANNGVRDKYGVVISTEFAEKYFGNISALGKQLQVKFEDVFLIVNGVVDIPENSSIKFDIMASYETGEEIMPWMKDVHNWQNTFSMTYVLLKDGIKPNDIQDKMQNVVIENFFPVGESKAELNLLPFKEYHAVEESNQTLIIILAIIALGIIGIAIVNFINLAITNALSRIKEIGIKKVHGATKQILFRQIMTESFMVSFIALILGIVIMILLLPTFNLLFETNLQFNPFQNKILLLILALIWGIVGALSGLIPSLFWAKSKLAQSLRGNLFSGNKTSTSRYSLIVVQFVIAIVLISGTFLIQKQINTMIEKDPKFDKENVIITELEGWQFENLEMTSQNFKRISEELETSPYVESVSFSQSIPGTYQENYNVFYPDGKSIVDILHIRKAYVGEDYFKTFGINLLSGFGFEKKSISYNNTVVLNKRAMDELGFDEAREQVLYEGSKTGKPYRIIGIVDDFSYQGVQREIQPLAHFYSKRENLTDWNYMIVKAKAGANLQAIELLKKKWKAAFTGVTINYFFADDKLNEQYKEYVKVNTLITWFSILAIILSCMGLFALSSYVMARRTKEIGIRKVNGAKVSEILTMLNKDFLKWVVLSFVIAVPISWYAMQKWLEGFAYKTTISWWIFVLAGFAALCIALLTVSWQSFRAATNNPVDALRDE